MLAAEAGVSMNTVLFAERWNMTPRRATQQKIAAALGVTPGELFPEMKALVLT